MNIVLISTYELGHQPFGLASPKAWLAREGHRVTCADLAIESLPEAAVGEAEMVAFYLPMHTATRLAMPVIERVKELNPRARLVCYGLYAPLNEALLRDLGVHAIVGGEFEAELVKQARQESAQGSAPAVAGGVFFDRLDFVTPDRAGMPALERYSRLRLGSESKTVAYTEASRGCKHLCRHCPIVPVYQGQFRVVQRDVVLEDVRQQVAAGARHVTFGDPDFFNGPGHARRIVEAMNDEFPSLTYDATIKIEHLLQHRDLLSVLRETGCLFITSAVESVDDAVLEKLEKHHTRRDFFDAVELTRAAGLTLQPTFIAFMPWTTRESYQDLLRVLGELDLIENVPPVQLALRLLITSGSRLLELDDVRALAGQFDSKRLVYPWSHPDPEVDALSARVFGLVQTLQKRGASRTEIFSNIWDAAGCGSLLDQLRPGSQGGESVPDPFAILQNATVPRVPIPQMDEPWYCCAEPMEEKAEVEAPV